ncbi:unnamed protein product [Linum trigynum]|uniref:Uncharacterized protein n=1 Tax=Linum trigynum TaxID=586398 RepID=A0AAV2DB88_9ROSI
MQETIMHQLVSEPGFDPGTYGLWAHHASAAPSPSIASSSPANDAELTVAPSSPCLASLYEEPSKSAATTFTVDQGQPSVHLTVASVLWYVADLVSPAFVRAAVTPSTVARSSSITPIIAGNEGRHLAEEDNGQGSQGPIAKRHAMRRALLSNVMNFRATNHVWRSFELGINVGKRRTEKENDLGNRMLPRVAGDFLEMSSLELGHKGNVGVQGGHVIQNCMGRCSHALIRDKG